MSSKIIYKNGMYYAVYSDEIMPLLKAMGIVHIERATDVEYDDSSQEWKATYRPTGEVIAHGPNRYQVIKEEVSWLERRLCLTQ